MGYSRRRVPHPANDRSRWLKAVLKTLVLPPTSLLLFALIGLGCMRRAPRAGRALTAAGILGLLVLAMPIVGEVLTWFVDTSTRFDGDAARSARAVVILGGGVRRNAPEYGGDTMATLTLERVRYGARVARQTGLPVLVSGGSVIGGQPEATLMAAALEREFGVPVRWIEPRSRTTHENTAFSAAKLKREGIDHVVLVTHAFDTRRAVAEFEAQGMSVVVASTGGRAAGEDVEDRDIFDYLPSMGGLTRSYYAVYEILANLVWFASRAR